MGISVKESVLKVILPRHTGIPFLHWFSKNRIRYCYTLVLRYLGFGSGLKKPEITPRMWVDRKLNYMDTKTFYRKAKEIKSLFNKYFNWSHHEEEIINFRAEVLNNQIGKMIKFAMKMPGLKQFGEYSFTRLAGYLIIANPKWSGIIPTKFWSTNNYLTIIFWSWNKAGLKYYPYNQVKCLEVYSSSIEYENYFICEYWLVSL